MRDDNEYSKYDDLLSKLTGKLPVDDNGYTKNVIMEGIPFETPTVDELNPIPLRNDTPLDMSKLMQPKAPQADLIPTTPPAPDLPKAQKSSAQPAPVEASPALPDTQQASPMDELKAAQEQRNSELNNLAIFRGLMNVGQGLGYQKYDPTIGKDFETISNNKVADVMQRKDAQVKDIDFKKASMQLKNAEAEGDPKSEVSRALREAIKRRYQFIGHPININDSLSAAQLKTMYPSGDLADDFLKMDALKASRADKAEAKKAESNVGQKAVDRDFAKDFNDYTQGGLSRANRDIATLGEMRGLVAKEANSLFSAGGGPVSGSLPDWARTSKSIEIRDNVITAANSALKSIFGGQLSDKEREAAAKEFYNDKLGPNENLKILDRKLNELENIKKEKDAKVNYFQNNNNSLAGFKYSPQEPAAPAPSASKSAGQKDHSQSSTVERLDKKTGKVALFDAKTKKFVKWKGE